MCGIAGIYGFDGPAPWRSQWEQMIDHLRHRGPDEGGLWADGSFFLGHRRLSIVGLSSGGQPMCTAEGDLAVTFNGEIYNYPALRAELERAGHLFRTTSDTEVLLHGYRQWGSSLPARLTGMFAFAVADQKRRQLFLARDRFGEKPLFLLNRDRYVAFASELRPLAALPDCPQDVNQAALGRYLLLNYVPGSDTLLTAVERLPPATWRLYDGPNVQQKEYWQAATVVASLPTPAGDLVPQFQQRLDSAVQLTLQSDVPVGILLSGGIDSALVAESAVRQGSLERAYVLDIQARSYSEAEGAEAVARRLGLQIERVPLTPPTAEQFLALVEHADDPLADSSSLAVWTLARHVAQRQKVVLGGDGADEIFGGYLTYRASALHQRMTRWLPPVLRRAVALGSGWLPTTEGKVTFSYKLRRFLRAFALPTSAAHFTWNGTWLPSEAARLAMSPTTQASAARALGDFCQAYDLSDEPELLALQLADSREYLPNDILTKVDRMSMAHGLEVRAPFLNHDLAAWGLSLPAEAKISRRGELKTLLRRTVRERLGPEIADRPKQGFSIPVHAWIRGPLRDLFADLLSPSSLNACGLLDVAGVTRVWQSHMAARGSLGFELWGLGVLVAWRRARVQTRPAATAPCPTVDRSNLRLAA